MPRQSGFTLLELMIVVAIIAIIAAIALPNLLSSRLTANEAAAIATLRNISSAQAQFQATSKADEDEDGMGEYGAFRELSGAIAVREGSAHSRGFLRPVVLSSAFRNTNAFGEVNRSGYRFKIYLPADDGTGLCPDELGSFENVNEGLAETTWCCYAWPSNYSMSGTRSFMVNQTGDVIATENKSYSGPDSGPAAGSAFSGAGSADSITGLTAVGTMGRDGFRWRQVQ